MKTTDKRPTKDGKWVEVKYGMWRDERFEVVVNIYEERRGELVAMVAGACDHALVAETFPELVELSHFHGCDKNGVPLNYIHEGIKWTELAAGVSEQQGRRLYTNGRSIGEILASNCLSDVLQDGNILADKVENFKHIHYANGKALARWLMTEWLNSRRPAMKAAFRKAMKKHNVAAT